MLGNLRVKRAHRPDDEIKPHTSAYNILTIIIAGLGSFVFGYANNTIAGSLAQTSFIEKFLSGGNADQVTDGIMGAFLGGGLLGSLGQAPISQKYGRRVATGTAAILITISGALQAGSVDVAMFIVSRFICGFGAGMVITNCPVYMSEISPPHTRGMLVANHAISIVYAYITCSAVALGLHFVDHSYQWRLQFVFLTFFALCLLASMFVIPESPRWLVEQDRHDEAWTVLERLHRHPHDPESTLAHAEMIQIKAQVHAEKSLPKGYVYIFKTPHLRKRALCAILVWIMGQSTGVLVIANLTPVLFRGLGYGIVLQLGLSVVWAVCALVGCLVDAFLMDRVGRVKLLGFGGYLCAATLLVEGLLQKYYLGTQNHSGLDAAVAMFFIWIVFYGSTIDCAAYVYVSEIWPTHLRSQGATIGLVSFFATAIAYNSPASKAFATIGWRYYIVFVVVCCVSATAILFVLPETAGLTLEEISAKFGDHVEVEWNHLHVDHETHKIGEGVYEDPSVSQIENVSATGDKEKGITE
ncbi:MAG: hypothetical protein M1819_000877 [Sarea resinae]|nr:MAG: hypothetical protein M1819_000877 [Sarea resinae]